MTYDKKAPFKEDLLIKEGKWKGEYIEKKSTTSRYAKKFIPPMGKQYKQILKESNHPVDLVKYKRLQEWGGSL